MDTRKKCFLACCVSDSHHPTRREVVLGSDDSSFVAVWDSPIRGIMTSSLSTAGTSMTRGEPTQTSPGTLGVIEGS